ncbi:hypothetical protein PRZ48_008193 [Zasmidium cellare]|uniref:Ketoreductase domain-containing protein n=1 Tax=Zasmidium cellare TaxID=395010 RepID=A0ABR0EEV3_ZASCE|nr:hypothetical protein PRZ48_008193 [Zasmidium cellare]
MNGSQKSNQQNGVNGVAQTPSFAANLHGKTAIVTGSSRGIGAGIAAELGRRGANVVLNYVTDRGAQAVNKVIATIKSEGGKAVAVKGSVTEKVVRDDLIQAAVELSPSRNIDILVHNAGNGDDRYLVDINEEFFDMQVGINLKAPVFLTQAALEHMPRGSRIVIVSSCSARMGVPEQTVYAASKVGTEALARVWATELGQSRGITVNCVNPGPVATDMYYESSQAFIDSMKPLVESTPAEARMGEVRDIVPLIQLVGPVVDDAGSVIVLAHLADNGLSSYPARYQFLPYSTTNPGHRRQRSQKESVEKQISASPAEQEQEETTVQDAATPVVTENEGMLYPVFMGLKDLTSSMIVDTDISKHLVISVDSMTNPFSTLLLPLAYQHFGVLQALLGLALCHSEKGRKHSKYGAMPLALELKLSAIHSLSELLQREQGVGLSADEEEVAMAMALLLILHDITESGISTHGAHLNGVTSFCSRSVENPNATKSPLKQLMLTAFAWYDRTYNKSRLTDTEPDRLDILRGFSGSDKLAFSNDVRQKILDNREFTFEVFSGCPSVLCRRIGKVLSAGKAYLENELSLQDFEVLLGQAETFLRAWSPDDEAYPSADHAWRLLANAYRHACLLRVIRFPQPLNSVTPDHPSVVESVEAILDVCAELQLHNAKFHKRLLFPLFMAGAESSNWYYLFGHWISAGSYELDLAAGLARTSREYQGLA